MNNKLHIVTLEMPWPPDYGGVIGIFNRLKALHASGLETHLHVFYYDRLPDKELEQFCSKVYYYKRDMRKTLLFSKYPFIVASRISQKLLKNLQQIEAPILFEGLHTCHFLSHPSLKDRIRLVRTHNIEHEYYYHLSMAEKSVFKKWYLRRESEKLERFEKVLENCDRILSVVESDQEYFERVYGHSELIPVFIDDSKFHFTNEVQKIALYHGNLSVAENYVAAGWLVDHVFSKLSYPSVIAGKNPPRELKDKIAKHKNIELLENPSTEVLNDRIFKSAVIVLPTFQATGIKLKLLDTLMKGKHCLVNPLMLTGTGLSDFCSLADTPDKFISETERLMSVPFDEKNFLERKKHMKSYFNNEKSVNRIKTLIRASTD